MYGLSGHPQLAGLNLGQPRLAEEMRPWTGIEEALASGPSFPEPYRREQIQPRPQASELRLIYKNKR
jgi:hypothetical protein